jgi:energy-coupling factor transporter ATP-binding protein EcfA2
MHASAVSFRGKAYIFTGPSGAGKSTIVKLLSGSPQFIPFADNNVFLLKKGKTYLCYKSPFLEWQVQYASPINPQDMRLRLGKIFVLKKSKTSNAAKELSFSEAMRNIARQIQLPLSALTKEEEKRSRRQIFEFITHHRNEFFNLLYFKKEKGIFQLFLRF